MHRLNITPGEEATISCNGASCSLSVTTDVETYINEVPEGFVLQFAYKAVGDPVVWIDGERISLKRRDTVLIRSIKNDNCLDTVLIRKDTRNVIQELRKAVEAGTALKRH